MDPEPHLNGGVLRCSISFDSHGALQTTGSIVMKLERFPHRLSRCGKRSKRNLSRQP
jgi:hypothetical protein